jgi:hypothetical protein
MKTIILCSPYNGEIPTIPPPSKAFVPDHPYAGIIGVSIGKKLNLIFKLAIIERVINTKLICRKIFIREVVIFKLLATRRIKIIPENEIKLYNNSTAVPV